MKNLLIRPQGLGDLAMMVPALRGLIKNNPEEEFTLLTYKGFGQIFPPDLNIKIMEFPRHAGFLDMIRLVKRIRQQHFDRLFDLYCNPRTAQLSLFSGIRDKYGFPCRNRSFVYNHLFQRNVDPGQYLHQVDLYSQFFNFFGFKCEILEPTVKMPKEVIENALKAIPEEYKDVSPRIAINTNTTFPTRGWPVDRVAEFIELWYEKTKQPVMLTWGPGEEENPKAVIAKVGNKAYLHKPVKLNEFVALMSQIDLLITNDTGPAYMAWSTGTPVITLFGPTTEQEVGPRGKNCVNIRAKGIDCARCHKEQCGHRKCMWAITPEMVMEQIKL